jgi:hypothetical protein
MWRGKVIRKRTKSKPKSFHPYRSGLEKRIASVLLNAYEYEPKEDKVEYTVPHKYLPDFVCKSDRNILIEVKGYFRYGSQEMSKYVAIKKDNPEKELVFIFSDPTKKAHSGCRVRKDGTLMTMAEWATKQGFLFYGSKEIPRVLAEGKASIEWILKEKERRGIKVC